MQLISTSILINYFMSGSFLNLHILKSASLKWRLLPLRYAICRCLLYCSSLLQHTIILALLFPLYSTRCPRPSPYRNPPYPFITAVALQYSTVAEKRCAVAGASMFVSISRLFAVMLLVACFLPVYSIPSPYLCKRRGDRCFGRSWSGNMEFGLTSGKDRC